MSAAYTFDVDPARDLVRIRMDGFFTVEDIHGFVAARAEAHRQLLCGPNQHLTLNDLRGMKIQSQEIVAEFRDLLAAPQYRSRRLAFVVATSLARQQLLRALASRDARCFLDIASAEAWLLTGDDSIAA